MDSGPGIEGGRNTPITRVKSVDDELLRREVERRHFTPRAQYSLRCLVGGLFAASKGAKMDHKAWVELIKQFEREIIGGHLFPLYRYFGTNGDSDSTFLGASLILSGGDAPHSSCLKVDVTDSEDPEFAGFVKIRIRHSKDLKIQIAGLEGTGNGDFSFHYNPAWNANTKNILIY